MDKMVVQGVQTAVVVVVVVAVVVAAATDHRRQCASPRHQQPPQKTTLNLICEAGQQSQCYQRSRKRWSGQ